VVKRPSPVPLPTKQELLDYIRDSDRPLGKRDIARAFRVKGADRTALRALLKELVDDGLIDRGHRRRLAPKGSLPEVTVIQISHMDLDGELFARPMSWRSDDEPPRIVVVPGRRRGAAPKVGDRVLARLRRVGEASYEAQPIRIIEGGTHHVLGVLEPAPGGATLQPTDRRVSTRFFIPGEQLAGAEAGDLVVIEGLPGAAGRSRPARVIERLGAFGSAGTVSLIAIHSHGIPDVFPAAALAEAEAQSTPGPEGRRDLRSVPLVTIDGADARDFDDAVWAEPDPSPGNQDGWHLIVAIADVSYYVRPGSRLDGAARERGNSVYFPDRVVPMLPERLSNDLCSLRPQEDRACLFADLRIAADGRLLDYRFDRGLMRSAARLTYTQVQEAADGRPDEITVALMDTVIEPLFGAYRALERARNARGTLDLDIPERQVVLDDKGRIAAIRPRNRMDSHRLIEEFMICANVAAALTLENRRMPVMYRIHEPPGLDKVEMLRDSLASFGYRLAKGNVITPTLFAGILQKAAGTDHAAIVSELILRSQSQALYAPDPVGHFGLALNRYCHFTSPIRRYADILVHRALVSGLRLSKKGAGDGLSDEEAATFDEIGEHISKTERRAAAAERDAVDRIVTAYLANRVGETFSGRVNGVTRFGLFVTLDETGADGLVPVRTLPWDRYFHDERQHALIGEQSGLIYRLGDPLVVELSEADSVTGSMIFRVLEGGGRIGSQTFDDRKVGGPHRKKKQRRKDRSGSVRSRRR